jgi:hypothetical protein
MNWMLGCKNVKVEEIGEYKIHEFLEENRQRIADGGLK